MTSSLVGSEMCIRDSIQPVKARQQKCYLALYSTLGPGVSFGKLPWWNSVSYTHLTLPTICSV
eukprot:9294675-Prorocentrum_lima.AAC.1